MIPFWKRISLKSYILFVLLLGLTAAIFLTYTHYGVTYDEGMMIETGKHVLSYYVTYGKDASYAALYPWPEFYLTHGPIIEVLRQGIIQMIHISSIDVYHLVFALFTLSAFYFIFQIAYLFTNNVWISLVSFMFLVCMPRFYGDIFTNTKDIAPACVLLGSIYYSTRYFLGKRTLHTLLFLAIFFAIGTSLRPVLLYAYVLFFLISFVQMMIDKSSKKTYFAYQVMLLGVTLIFFYLSSPYLLAHPADVFKLISASEKYPWLGGVLFERIMYGSWMLPRYYVPKWIAISTPLLTLLCFILGNFYVISRFIKGKYVEKYIYSYLFALFWMPILIVISTKSVIYDAWRQFLFLSGPLILFAGLGVYVLIRSKNKIVAAAGIFLFVLNIFVTVREMVMLHPYEYIYFNSFVGGLKGAYGSYETDYFGASYKEATDWIVANRLFLSHDTLYIYPCLFYLAEPYIKPGVVINQTKATVFYCHTRWNQDQQLPGMIIHTIEREGIPLNVITMIKTD
jgi:hypothetical protein